MWPHSGGHAKIPGMSTPLREALGDHQRAVEAADAARERLYAAIVAALDAGMAQAEVVRQTGYTRETIRRVARDASP